MSARQENDIPSSTTDKKKNGGANSDGQSKTGGGGASNNNGKRAETRTPPPKETSAKVDAGNDDASGEEEICGDEPEPTDERLYQRLIESAYDEKSIGTSAAGVKAAKDILRKWRIEREFSIIKFNNSWFQFVVHKLLDEDDDRWVVLFTPHEGSIYAPGKYILVVRFPNDYPSVAPTLIFATPIYHINVNFKGVVHFDYTVHWHPDVSMQELLCAVHGLFSTPDFEIYKPIVDSWDGFVDEDDLLSVRLWQYQREPRTYEFLAGMWRNLYSYTADKLHPKLRTDKVPRVWTGNTAFASPTCYVMSFALKKKTNICDDDDVDVGEMPATTTTNLDDDDDERSNFQPTPSPLSRVNVNFAAVKIPESMKISTTLSHPDAVDDEDESADEKEKEVVDDEKEDRYKALLDRVVSRHTKKLAYVRPNSAAASSSGGTNVAPEKTA